MPEPDRILIVCPDSLSDLVAITPVFAALREHRAGATVSAIVPKQYEDLFFGHPGVDRIVAHDRRRTHRGPWRFVSFLRTIREQDWDIAIDLRCRGSSRLVARASGATMRLRAPRVRPATAFCVSIRMMRFFAHRTRVETYLRSLRRLEIPSAYRPPRLSLRAEWAGAARSLTKQLGIKSGPVVGIAPSSAWEPTIWPAERYAELAKRLSCSGAEVVLFGGQDDKDLCTKVAAGRSGVYDLAGRLSLGELLGFISQCAVFVGNDTGPTHCAVALGVPTVGLFGPTDGRQFVFEGGRIIQRTVPCGPCSIRGPTRCATGDLACMTGISVEEVLSSVTHLLPAAKEPEVQPLKW